MIVILAVTLTGGGFAFSQAPVPNFSGTPTSGCAPLIVEFTDLSTNNPTGWNWEFSNGTLSSVRNPRVTFAQPGTYSVKLVVRNASGIAQLERIDYITVFPSPVVNFSADLRLACAPATVNFTDLSTTPSGSITAWEWDFGDGTTSNQRNPSHRYTSTGFYNISLTVTTSNGCKRTFSRSNYIRMVSGIETNFSNSPPLTCRAPFTVQFQNQSSGPGNISFDWNLGNGQTSTAANPVATYTSPGTYTVRLNTRSDLGCTGTITKTITVAATVTDFEPPAGICVNTPVTFQNTSSSAPSSSRWDFGDGTISGQINPTKTYLVPGTYTVRLINTYAGCTDSVFKTVVVLDRPIANFIADDSLLCQAPYNVQFTDQSPGATSWLWDFGDGTTSTEQNPAHLYNTSGNYTVSLTITTAGGCRNTIVKTGYIQAQPITVNILNVPASGCVPVTYTPQATVNSPEPITSYSWDLGVPGAIFNTENPPPYTYTAAGTYTISLTVTTASGCTATATVPAAVRTGTPPVVNFTAIPVDGCASDGRTFTDLTVTTPGAEVTWDWDFGDGTSSSQQNPTHIFLDTGMLTVTLTVSNNGCRASAQQTVHVRPPVADFRHTVDCNTKQVTFLNSSIVDPALSPLTYFWEMGDPANTTFTTLNPPPFSYPGPGRYNVSLTVTNGDCDFKVTRLVIIADEPADFTIDKSPVCRNEAFTLTAVNSDPANISRYRWLIDGDTLPGSGRSITHRLPDAGTYDVRLVVIDVNGCITARTINDFITVTGPDAAFSLSPEGSCLGSPVTFTDQSTPAGSVISWTFNFGDGSTETFTAPPFAHTYTSPGAYHVTLTVRDASGCTDTASLPANIIITNPVAGFLADTMYCPGSPLQFIDTSSGAGLTYLWDFSDGQTSTLANPTHSYPEGDNDYTVKLTVRDISGCADSVTRENYIRIRRPKASFNIEDTATICPPLLTSFTFTGSDYATFNWNFGDGSTSSLPNPSNFYNNYGDFIPTLYVNGNGGCVDSAKAAVHIYNPNDIRINYGPTTTACNSLSVDFDIEMPPGFRFIFHFGDGQSDSSGSTSLTHLYERPSFNSPFLVVYDSVSGCQVTVRGTTRIDVLGALPLFSMDKKEFCDNGTVRFTDFTTKNEPIISTRWSFGDGGTSTEVNPVYTYTRPGTFIATLQVTTQSNCTNTYRDTVYVYRTPEPRIESADTICINTMTPINGLLAVPDTLTSWQFNFGNGQTSTQPNNFITYNTTGDYTIQLIASNKLGCSDTTTRRIYVSPLPTVSPVQDPLTIVVETGINLNMNYTGNIVSYNWSPATSLSCTNCPTPFASPQFTTRYTVKVEDSYGCRNSGSITVVVVCNDKNFFIPNTFSPNGDGKNEVFYPRGTGVFRIKSMTVFNRWGEIVFDRKDFAVNDPSQGWNGTFKGQKASADVYVYMIEILCDNNAVVPVKGNVTLLR